MPVGVEGGPWEARGSSRGSEGMSATAEGQSRSGPERPGATNGGAPLTPIPWSLVYRQAGFSG